MLLTLKLMLLLVMLLLLKPLLINLVLQVLKTFVVFLVTVTLQISVKLSVTINSSQLFQVLKCMLIKLLLNSLSVLVPLSVLLKPSVKSSKLLMELHLMLSLNVKLITKKLLLLGEKILLLLISPFTFLELLHGLPPLLTSNVN